MSKNTAVYAGTFDPPTNGHLWVIQKSADLFNQLVVAVAVNPEKKPLFSDSDRLEMIEKMIRPMVNVDYACIHGREFLVHYAQSIGASWIVRGIRSIQDYISESQMREVNRELAPEIETVFLVPPKELAHLSSSLVKALVGPKGWEEVISRYVPGPVFEKLKEAYDARLCRD